MKNVMSLILIALAIGLFFVYVLPQYSSLSTLRATESSYQSALASAKQLQTVRDTLLNSYNSISDSDKAKLTEMIPTTFDPVKLVSDISIDAAQYGMTVSGVKIDNANVGDDTSRADITSGVATSTYQTIQLSFTTTGQYTSFMQFLKDLESSVELLDLEKLSIQSSRTATGPESLNFDVTLDTYEATPN